MGGYEAAAPARSGHPGLLIFLAAALLATAAVAGGPAVIGLLVLAVLVSLIFVYPIVGLGAILITAPTYLLLTPYIPKGVPVSFLLLVITLIGVALRRVSEPRVAPFRWTWVDGAAALLLLNGVIYIPKAANLTVGIYGYHELFRLFLIYFVVRLLAPGPAAIRALLWCVALTGFLVVAYGCVQPFTGYDWVMHKYHLVESLHDYAGFNTGRVARAYSILVSPLSLGYMGMVGALSAVAILTIPRRDDLAARLAPLLLAASVGAAAFSYTRSAWLGIAASLLTALVMIFRGRDRLFIVFTPLVLVILLVRLVPLVAERFGRYALTIASQDPTQTNMHYVALFAAARYFWDHKLGVGLGAASFAGFQHGSGVKIWSENTFFQMGIQTGIQGMLLLLLFLALATVAARKLSRDGAAGRLDRRMATAAFLGFIAFSVAGMSIPTLIDVAAFGPLWVLAALVVNRRDTQPEQGG